MNVCLKQVNVVPYLGIQVYCSLKWNQHVLELCKKISRKLFCLKRMRKCIDQDTLLYLYISIIQPKIDYAISVWGYSSKSNKELITRLQHRAARYICGNMDFINVRGSNLVIQLGLQSIDNHRHYFTAMLMYKIANEIAPTRLTDSFIFTKDTHDISTRSSTNCTFQVPEPNYELYRNSLKYQGTVLWNALPPLLKSAPDVPTFKKLYKMLYFK